MKSFNNTLLFFVSILIFVPFSKSKAQVSPETLAALIENQMSAYNISGLSASIIKNGDIAWQGSFGMMNREADRPATDTTDYLLYSATKPFTGIALMQLQEQGLVHLDSSVNLYLPFEIRHPAYPNDNITLRMLMAHTAGIMDNWDVINSLMSFNEDTEISMGEFLENYLLPGGAYYGAASSFANYRPGDGSMYSNVGATLVGFIIECVSAQPYAEYMQEHILDPLEMTHSTFYLADLDTANLAMEYSLRNNQYHAEGFRSAPMFPAGFLHTRIPELNNFMMMLLNNGNFKGRQLISPETLELMCTPQYPDVSPYAGLLFAFEYVNEIWGHTGGYSATGTNRVKTAIFFDKEEDWGVCLLSNGDGEPWNILNMLYQYARDYKKLALVDMDIEDEGGEGILDENENAVLKLNIRNKTDWDLHNISALLESRSSLVQITQYEAIVDELLAGQICGEPLLFEFETGFFDQPQNATLCLKFYQDDVLTDSLDLNVYLGQADVLLVKDEEHIYSNHASVSNYYLDAVAGCGKTAQLIDLNLRQGLNVDFMKSFEAVCWFTGLENQNFHQIIKNDEQQLIAAYLEAGGRFFLSSQNAGESLDSTSFYDNWLHAEEVLPTENANQVVIGKDGTLTEGMNFFITGGDGSNTQYSPSSINALSGAELIFEFSQSGNGAGLMYDGPYRLVYLPFGFSSIHQQAKRTELMQRILDFFAGPQDLPENDAALNEIKIYPNPAVNGKISVELLGGFPCMLEVFNSSGTKCFERNLSGELHRIGLDGFSPGFYFLRVHSSGISQKHSFIVL